MVNKTKSESMKKTNLISAAIVVTASFANAAEHTNITSNARRVEAVGRARATIVAPVSAMVAKDMSVQVLSKNSRGSISGKGLSSAGEILLSGPKNQLVTVNVSENLSPTQSARFKPRLLNAGRLLALDGKNGEAKLKIGGVLSSKNMSKNSEDSKNRVASYYLQVSY